MKDKKISDIAKELGVSRQSIYKRINKTLTTELTPFVYKDESGTTLIKPKGVAIIKNSFVLTSCQELSQPVNSVLQENLIELMKDQLDALKAQLETKDNQISELNKRLAESSRQTEIMQHLLRSEQEKGKLLIETKPQRGFKRWFGAKKDGSQDE